MSIETPSVDVNTDDLDAFSDLFHGKAVEAQAPDDGQDENDVSAPLEDTPDSAAPEDNDDADAVAPEKEVKLTPTQKRINQLLEKERLALERAERAEAALRAKENTGKAEPTSQPAEQVAEKVSKEPHPDDKNPDGTDKYPLGHFDPQYADDRLKYNIDKETAAYKAQLEAERQQAEAEKAAAAAQEAWNAKLVPAQERYPDFQEQGQNLLETFQGIEPAYGEYLTNTIMGMEYGPDVLYHLATNIDEANRIVGLGPMGATLALGRLEYQFASSNKEATQTRAKVSAAPTPPPMNKGSAVSMPEVPDDTDDLDAFSEKFFKTPKR